MSRVLSRRRALSLIAAGSFLPLIQVSAASRGGTRITPVRTWRGEALGSAADVRLYHHEAAVAEQALAALRAEVARLEAVFSLFRDDSALCRLNRAARLDDAPAELLEVLDHCAHLYDLTNGAFDPSVQPLWSLYAAHFASADAGPEGPAADAVAAARTCVGYDGVRRLSRTVSFAHPGMALTLNGIAQGYLTDRARAILADAGMPHALINLGEYRALGPRPDGSPWRIAITDPALPWRTLTQIPLAADRAVATSAGAGTAFDRAMRHHHLFDPRTGESARGWRSVTVIAPTATIADGLSTGLAVAPVADAELIVARFRDVTALLVGDDGGLRWVGADFRGV